MTDADIANSYYIATAHPAPRRPALQGEVEADVGIVGGGFTGLSAALHLAERGYKVVLVEAHSLGWGASGRNGGQLGGRYHGAGSSQAAQEQLTRDWLGDDWQEKAKEMQSQAKSQGRKLKTAEAAYQIFQERLQGVSRQGELFAEHGEGLQQLLRCGGQPVDARGQYPLDGSRELKVRRE